MKLIREIDPESAITRHAIDRLINTGKLPTVRIGNKLLINVDLLLEIVGNGTDIVEVDEQTGIRRIEV